jgi:hypothetical protein
MKHPLHIEIIIIFQYELLTMLTWLNADATVSAGIQGRFPWAVKRYYVVLMKEL